MDYGHQSKLVKKPADVSDLTEHEAEEFVKCANDIYYFLETYVKTQHPELGSVNFVPRSYQRDMIDNVLNENWCIFNAPRQCGKTVSMVSIILWYTIFHNDYKVGMASHKLSSIKDVMQRLRFSYEELPFFLKPAVKSYNVFNIVFDNNSSIIAESTTENTFRGKSLNFVMLDEFSFVNQRIAEDFWVSLLPSLTSSGSESKTKLCIISTPNGSENLYAKLWFASIHGENGFVSYKVDPNEIEGRDEAFRESIISKIGEIRYRTEYCGEFLSSKPTLISSVVLESLRPRQPIAYYRDMAVYEQIKGRTIAIGMDIGGGVGLDNHALVAFDANTLEQIAMYKNNTIPQVRLVEELAHFLHYFFKQGAEEIYYGIESNNLGHSTISLLLESDLDVFQEAQMISTFKSKLPGINTNKKTKMFGAMKLKDLMERYMIKIHSKELLTELRFFVQSGQSFKAEEGTKDDIVMAVIVLMNVLEEVSFMEDDLNDKWNALDYEEEDPPMIVV